MTGTHTNGNGCIYGELDEDYNGKNYCALGDNKYCNLNNGEYHHVLFSRNENKVKLCIDGNLSQEVECNVKTNVTGESDFRLGRSYTEFTTPEIYFKDFRYYSYPIEDEELRQIIKEGN